MIETEFFFEEESCTTTCVLYDKETKIGAIFDSVLNYDIYSGKVSTRAVDGVIAFVERNGISVKWICETHAHADHVTAAALLKHRYPQAKTMIGEHIVDVQQTFVKVFKLDSGFCLPNGGDFDVLLTDGQVIYLDEEKKKHACRIIHTPGHTPACVCYYFEEDKVVLCGDTIFMPDQGTARCDFPGGSSSTLYDSIQRILSLPKDVVIIVGHDYKPGRSEYKWQSTISEETRNIHLYDKEHDSVVTREDYIKVRDTRDKTLSVPKLLYPSIQFNIRCGKPPTNAIIHVPVTFPKLD